MHHTTAEVLLMPLGHVSIPGTLCIQNVLLATAHQTAGTTLGRATDRSPIKMHHLERYTGLEWHDHAKTAAALYTLTLVLEHAQTHHGIPLHAKGARNGSTC